MKWYLHALKNTFNYQGRARRAEFGWFYLVNFLVYLVMMVLVWVIIAIPLMAASNSGIHSTAKFNVLGISALVVAVILGLYQLLTFFTTLSLTARRLHDLGKSGWWQLLIYVLPLIYFIIVAVAEIVFDPFDNGSMGNNLAIFNGISIVGYLVVTLISLIFFVLLLFKDGQRVENKYGADPKAEELAKLLEAADKLRQSAEKVRQMGEN